MGPVRTLLSGQRWHFAHGPIELVIGAEAAEADDGGAIDAAHDLAWQRFGAVLQELVAELPRLRQPISPGPCPVQGPVAKRMWQACQALSADFITPMAAVAGSVAEEILQTYVRAGLHRAYVNNGGDIALHLAPSASWSVGLVADIARTRPALDGQFVLHGVDPVRGIATSGWRGRSQSLGIADAVTVLARDAAAADAAATIIANAVNCDDPRIERAPANRLRDDSDLGERLVTTHVPALSAQHCQTALQAGAACARHLQAVGLIHAAVLSCQGQVLTVQPLIHPFSLHTLPLAA